MRCTVKLERMTGAGGGGALSSNRTIRDSELSLARNEFREVILVVQDRDRKLRIPIRHEELVVHRRFAGEGKATLTVKDQVCFPTLLRAWLDHGLHLESGPVACFNSCTWSGLKTLTRNYKDIDILLNGDVRFDFSL